MELYITSSVHNLVTLQLRDGERLVDQLDFNFDRNLDTALIQAVDKLLKKNTIDIHAIDSATIDEAIDKNSSLFKILQTFKVVLES